MDIDPRTIQSAIITKLPVHTRWMIHDTPLDYDFSPAHRGIRAPEFDVENGGTPDWFALLVFGKYDYAEGGGAAPWLCINKTDGSVVGLDFEAETAIFRLNSSLERFIRTFSFLDSYLSASRLLPGHVEVALREIDPDSYPGSDWRLLVDYLTKAQ